MASCRAPLLVLIVAIFLSYQPATGAEQPWKIDEQTALRLASEAYGVDEKWFDYDAGLSRRFFVYYGLTESDGSFGFFAVNPWTGDVWSLWGCRRLSTPALRKSQAEIRRRFTRHEMRQYRRLAQIKPECI
jgi:hypothetical protein